MPEEVPCRQVLESLPQRLMSNLLAATVNMAYLTEEVLDSSRRVLSHARGNKNATVGLQQWFSPPEAAELIAGVFTDRFGSAAAVLDPAAGAGALLEPFSPGRRFGIEIDADHVPAAGAADPDREALAAGAEGDDHANAGGVFYRGIRGDAQKVVPMLRAAGVRFPAVVLNPPFGLGWRDAVHANGSAGREINSTVLAYLWALDLLKPFGQGAMICGTGRLAARILSRPEGPGVYAWHVGGWRRTPRVSSGSPPSFWTSAPRRAVRPSAYSSSQ